MARVRFRQLVMLITLTELSDFDILGCVREEDAEDWRLFYGKYLHWECPSVQVLERSGNQLQKR